MNVTKRQSAKTYLLLVTILGLGFVACSDQAKRTDQTQYPETSASLEELEKEEAIGTEASLPASTVVPIKAEEVIYALRNRNLERLASLVHPKKGLKLSPEVVVEEGHMTFPADKIPGLFEDQKMYDWGKEDGSGKLLRSDFVSYFNRYMYDVDFAETDSIFYNQSQQHGNAINNVSKAYPGCYVVEYYVPEVDPKLYGMDWRALRLIFEPYQNDWKLVGLAHASWTP